ncbi:unnamed protein product [Moneuplotes crassus]|uniref:Uncharacterized protein n=1 Tax=Euplotes crassus TaxID=5936 RepID=A0AAD2CWV8_EUPCR|nr:unnamed protein product [Moneuplotes crassus]
MSQHKKLISINHSKYCSIKSRIHQRQARNSMDQVRERRNPFKNLVINNGNELMNSETIKYYIKNSFDSKTSYLRLQIANLVAKQKEMNIFKEKYLKKTKDSINNEFTKNHQNKEASIQNHIERLRKVLEKHTKNPFNPRKDLSIAPETKHYFHPRFKLEDLGPSYSSLSLDNKVKLIDTFLHETYEPVKTQFSEKISDYSDNKSFHQLNSSETLSGNGTMSGEFTLSTQLPARNSSTSFRRGRKERITLLPKGNIKKNQTYLERKIKQNNIIRSGSLNAIKMKGGAMFKRKSKVRLTDIDHFRIIDKIKQFRQKKGF